ncbi:MAG: hypothetical protein HZB51_28920 [Chloroflexi bacterium]|nr:hypothetical protein [Chloroflexota bacterium]
MATENIETMENGVTRRQLLTTATVGGVALIAGAVGGSALTNSEVRTAAETELAKLRSLLGLYEQLEKVGIDQIIATGMNVVRGALEAIKTGVKIARAGIIAVETAIKNFQAMVDNLRAAADVATRILNDLSQKFQAAQALVVSVLGSAQPLADSIGNFFTELIKKIPFGIGDNFLRAINALTDLIRAIPATVDAMLNQLLKPLRDLFFPPTGNALMKTNLTDPISQNLLTPLGNFLTDVETFLDSWEKNFVQPVQGALDERAKVRKQIVAMRNDIGLV